MEIYLYSDPNTDSIRFPVNPKAIEVNTPQKIETFETIGQGELKFIGKEGARKLSLSSFFPVKQYGFRRDFRFNGMEYIRKIKRWRDLRIPVTILIDDLDIYFQCVIPNINYSIQDGSGDIYYTLELEEYIIPQIKTTVSSQIEMTTVSASATDIQADLYATVNAKSGLNLRSGAGLSYGVLTAIPNNTKVKVYRKEDEWWQVNYNNKTGYANKKYLKEV